MVYFLGNILSKTDDQQPEADDETFAFTLQESRDMQCTGLPIRLEHDDNLVVGTVKNSWTDPDGRKWVIGHLPGDSYESIFAKHAVRKSSDGHRYYDGLSLGHKWTQFEDGSTKKTGLEISLCQDPRREDCRIRMIGDYEKNEDSININHHASKNTSAMAEASSVEKKVDMSLDTKTPEPPAAAPAAPGGADDLPDRQTMMKMIIDQQAALDQLAELKKQQELKEAEELKRAKAKTEAMGKAFLESVQEVIDPDVINEHKDSIMALAQNFPKECIGLLQVAHCASKKAKKLIETDGDQELKQKFKQVMRETSVTASAPKQVEKSLTDRQRFNKIMSSYQMTGTTADLHRKVYEEGRNKKRKMF